MAEIPLPRLAYPLALAAAVAFLYLRWSGDRRTPWVAIGRMLVQLLLVGYVLAYIFQAEAAGVVFGVLLLMAAAAGWIGLRTALKERRRLYPRALLAILLGAGSALMVAVLLVLRPEPWYKPAVWIPLGGMAFSNAMNAISLAAERLFAELERGVALAAARAAAYRAALIPATNALFAVGLVSIPGLMTGQILAGVSPLVAARYQILVMLMVYSAAGLSAALFLLSARGRGCLGREDRSPV